VFSIDLRKTIKDTDVAKKPENFVSLRFAKLNRFPLVRKYTWTAGYARMTQRPLPFG